METQRSRAPTDPATPVIEAHAGDPLRIHVFGAHSEQNSTFSVEGHQWPLEPALAGTEIIRARAESR